MRLLLLDQFSDLGGAQRMLMELLVAIRQSGWQGLVGLPGNGEMFQRVEALGFEAARIECGPYSSGRKSAADVRRFLTGTWRLSRQIRELARRIRAELVYINGPRLLPGAAIAGLRTPVLFHAHSCLSGPVRWAAGLSLRRMNAEVIAVCQLVAESYRPFVGAGRVSVIYNGVPGPDRVLARGNRRPPNVGSIGRIAPEKGQLEFLRVASLIHRARPDCRFLIYGAPLFKERAAIRYDQEVRAAAAGLPVEFPGWVTDVYAALANLDLLLVPSVRQEANPVVILEAFAAGVPVIAYRTGGIPEIVEDGRTGFLCKNAEQMASIASELLADDMRRAAISRGAQESWSRQFTVEHYRRQVIAAIAKYSESGSPGKRP
ncbi:MAG: glycosyltransferase family 4 protein [Acidobacteriia bacterium]|nr:glycosyltransferase family 4 protein [Terriglobia bacterium]